MLNVKKRQADKLKAAENTTSGPGEGTSTPSEKISLFGGEDARMSTTNNNQGRVQTVRANVLRIKKGMY